MIAAATPLLCMESSGLARDAQQAMSEENVEIVREVIARFNRDGLRRGLQDARGSPPNLSWERG